VLACHFCLTTTASFRVVYGFGASKVGTRRLLLWKTTEDPTADWTAQQFRTAITGEASHQ